MGDRATLGSLAVKRGLVGGPFGSKLGKKDYVSTGVPVIRGQNLDRGRYVSLDDCVYVAPEKVKVDLAGNVATPGDLVFTQRGTLGQVAIMPDGAPPSVISQSQMRLRVDREVADPSYVYYWATSDDCLRQISDRAIVSGVPHINLGILRDLSVPSVPLDEQGRIADVLGAFDDLIDTNAQLADQMDTLLSTVVQDSLDRAEESEPLSTYADFVNGRNFTEGADGTGRPVVRTPEVRLGPSGSTPRNAIDAVDANVARSGDTLFVWSGSLTLGRWRWEDGLVNQHVFKVIRRAGTPDWLPYQLIQRQLPWFLSLAADKATTMGHIQRRHLDAPVPALEASVLSRLDEIAGPLWDASLDARIEADRLAGVRDQLLPLFMSGRITVDEAWEAVS